MKKTLLIILFCSFISNSFSQSDTEGLQFGVKGGLNLSSITGTISFSTLASYSVGAFASVPVVGNFRFQPELLYNSIGGKNEKDITKFKYVNVPLLMSYRVPNTKLYFVAGPQLGFLLSAKETLDDITEDIKKDIKPFELSANIGAHYYVLEKFKIGLRYQFGLSNISKSADQAISFTEKNSVFNLHIGYAFIR